MKAFWILCNCCAIVWLYGCHQNQHNTPTIDLTQRFSYSTPPRDPLWHQLDTKGIDVIEYESNILLTMHADRLFWLDSDELRENATPLLNGVAHAIKRRGHRYITICGHSDGIGQLEKQASMTRKRAIQIENFLSAQGISRKKIKINNTADLFPIIANQPSANRRITMYLSTQPNQTY